MKKINLVMALIGLTLSAMLVFSGCEQLSTGEPPPRNIVKPFVSIQPKSVSHHIGDVSSVQLKIIIWDWNQEEEGQLSFQWYTFDTIEQYIDSGGKMIAGETNMSYDSASHDTTSVLDIDVSGQTAGTKYYYVVITNTNPEAGDKTTDVTRSEVAAVSLSNPGDPLIPVILRNPSDATYTWGAILNALRVEAQKPGDKEGELEYRWYFNRKRSMEGGTLTGENQPSLLPDYEDLDLDNNYYYVEVISSENGKSAVARSIPASVFMEPGFRALAPIITIQPQDKLYFVGETLGSLTVAGESSDKGTISYQWYSNTTASSKGGTKIAGETNATYTPTISNTSANNYYYYAEVINTNEKVKEEKTATTASKSVRVSIANAAGEVASNVKMTIPNPLLSENRFQYIRGYGGMDVAWGNFPRTTRDDTELMYDPDRLGYNMLRIMIRADNVDPSETINMLVNSDRPDYYENVKIVNKYGGYVAASPWTPPKEWKSNNSINGGGYLLPRYYDLFAQYLRNFAQNMYNNGAPIYCISISNEPNYVAGYDGCEWTPEEMRDFFLEQGHFTNGIRGYGGGKEIPTVLTMNGESANTPGINIAALENSKSKANIDVLARHIYGERRTNLWDVNSGIKSGTVAGNEGILAKKDADGNDVMMEIWMTEHNINSANATGYYNDSTWNYVWRFMNDVDLVIRLNNENAFVWWASKRFYSMVGDGQFGTTDGAPLPRGWGLSHYARFTTGMTRIAINPVGLAASGGGVSPAQTMRDGQQISHVGRSASKLNNVLDEPDNDAVRITAFTSADYNEISVVLWAPIKADGSGGCDPGIVEIAFPSGFTAHGVTAVISNKEGLFRPYDVKISSDRSKAYVELGKNELVSVKFSK